MNKSILLGAVLAVFSMNTMADVMGAAQAQPVKPQVPEIMLPDGTKLPTLSVVFDCGDCEPGAKVKALIESAYADQAKEQKVAIDSAVTYTYKVSNYRSRGAARFLVGALSGADKIAGSFDCNGAAVEVSDMAITAFNGIESVAINVGEYAFVAAKKCVTETTVAKLDVEVPVTAVTATPEVAVVTTTEKTEPYVPVLRDAEETQQK